MQVTPRAALRDLAAPELTSNDCTSDPLNRAAMVELLAAEQAIENVHFAPAFRFPSALASPPDAVAAPAPRTPS